MAQPTSHTKTDNIKGHPNQRQWRWGRLVPWLFIGGLVLFHAINNWIWLAENVTWAGWDKPRHLAQSLSYAHILSTFSIQSLFDAAVSDPIRPPLVPASASILYALLGRSADVATMINVVYMAIALAATYGLGHGWGGRRLGLVSVALLALFPMFYAMSRHFYLEFAMMAMVALAVYLLWATDGFQRRGASLLFGLGLGLGLLTKRTFAVFVLGPLLVAILSSGLLPALWQRLRQRPRIHWKSLLIAMSGGLALAGIWVLPNRETVQALALGNALFFLWWALAALTIYFASLPSAPLSNSLSAIFLAAGLASTWYLARVEFVERVALYAYGINDPRGRSLRLDQWDTYLYYLRKLGNEHISFALLVLMAAVVVAAGVVYLRRHRSAQHHQGQAPRWAPRVGWMTGAWLAGAYLLLTLSIYHETRAFTPALPAVALLFGAALLSLPWRWVRRGILALALFFGILQFLALSYESVQERLPPKVVDLPGWGQTSTWAQGVFIQLPDAGQTDRGYWITPDVLQRVEDYRLERGKESARLGLLVNTSQINAGSFIYLILTEYPNLRVESLIETTKGVELRSFDERALYRRIFANDYLVVKGTGNNADAAHEALIARILSDPPQLLAQAYEMVHTYDLPDGDLVYLYRQRHHLPADYPIEYVTRLALDLGERTRSGDAILLTPPELVGPFFSEYVGPANIYLAPDTKQELVDIATQHPRIFLVVGDPNFHGTLPSTTSEEVSLGTSAEDVQRLAQDWLNTNGFLVAHEWADSLRVVIYGTVAGIPPVTPTVHIGATLGGQAELIGYSLLGNAWRPGDIVPVTLVWQRLTPIQDDYNVFVQLLDGSGRLVAHTDSAPCGGAHPTSSWREGEIVMDRHGLLLAEDLAAEEYQLLTGLYLPETGVRLQAHGANGGSLGDSILLGRVTVR